MLRALREFPALSLSGAVASPASTRLGLDAMQGGEPCGILVTSDLGRGLQGAAVAVDFSVGNAVAANARACALARVPLLVGATGFNAAVRGVVESAAKQIPVLIAPNTSIGVSVAARLASLAASSLGSSFDVDIVEAHHRSKRDAPSGTALALGEAIAQARGQPPGSINISSLRAGDIVGEHTVIFAGAGERLEITHRATDRGTFARGALRAAEWLVGRPAGLYGMRDVLGL